MQDLVVMSVSHRMIEDVGLNRFAVRRSALRLRFVSTVAVAPTSVNNTSACAPGTDEKRAHIYRHRFTSIQCPYSYLNSNCPAKPRV
jgi:hypothetical protein